MLTERARDRKLVHWSCASGGARVRRRSGVHAAPGVSVGVRLACARAEAYCMASTAQKTAARRNIKKAASAAKRKRTIAHLSRKTKTALGKKGAAAAGRKKR